MVDQRNAADIATLAIEVAPCAVPALSRGGLGLLGGLLSLAGTAAIRRAVVGD